ncbi:MAG: ATP-binding protein [Burkholderiaceae bacterium]
MISIRRRLLLWISLGLGVALALAAALIYRQARQEADLLLDHQLRQLALSLPSHAFSPMGPGRSQGIDPDQDIVIQIWDFTGLRLYYSHGAQILPQRAELGFSSLRTPNGWWRIYSAELGDTVVQVAQPMAGRTALAAGNALRTLLPILLMLPVLGVVLWVSIGRGLAPVRRLAADVQARDAGTLQPLTDTGVPSEIQPLTHALNDLLGRLDRAIGAQRAFVADAAHELRTPLAALRLQLGLAERATDEAARRDAFADLARGLDRATRLVQQLLTLARQEPGAFEMPRAALDLRALAAGVVADHAPAAAQRGIDIGIDDGIVDGGPPPLIDGNADALAILIGNLVDNAVRYTQAGGRVDLRVDRDEAGRARLTVRDNGPGIPEDQLPRVFDRFHRVPGNEAAGSGLGLAIVRQIVLAHGAGIALVNDGGLEATVVFPARAAGDGVAPPPAPNPSPT